MKLFKLPNYSISKNFEQNSELKRFSEILLRRFANFDVVAKSEFIQFMKNYATTLVDLNLTEEYRINTDIDSSKILVNNDYIIAPQIDSSLLRITMLNVGQSVALEYYEVLTNDQKVIF